jgi:hypothetical protein
MLRREQTAMHLFCSANIGASRSESEPQAGGRMNEAPSAGDEKRHSILF